MYKYVHKIYYIIQSYDMGESKARRGVIHGAKRYGLHEQ